ncbi:hypothetical protein KMW28_27270 [Flammeovirga yaeyamensis]|uniref:Uncharacterized protein n=1 Tax=Flammeovirga yaeyamensis TaxID=367791 RepID=A0AAX1NAU4_9BACT|nr:hypothetical protein [Flammeovirga yaeyamensis]MBB3700017.1 hypothetical protein [Flammeovirga yaeyamensis]NMF37545.1 hypothetical protein [Flammeovirga yaeyamensis]QWG04602.1 hypothetical protein KMW28_27270 [Flammeovirga yaeyamensis]
MNKLITFNEFKTEVKYVIGLTHIIYSIRGVEHRLKIDEFTPSDEHEIIYELFSDYDKRIAFKE